ncbi:hypothetical protein PR202_gb07693 [Eleusine coracana subsp. coracana]|uniref:U1 small nuclear ribonucleoprotein 70 kDa n=1 Tax=Eleusine coracana subsp. coracana TaxID=191504 RepID=A0AAV5EC08_ELECO|nr:hypothetical protein PR202_gb07693 [Eleusine coracana subsp. coracana]
MGDYGHGGQMRGPSMDSRPKGGQRPNVQQLKLMGQIHPTGLTPNLLKLFEPRSPLEYKPPLEKRKLPAYTGMAQFVSHFAEPGDPEYAPPVPKCETRAEKKARIRQNKLEQGAAKVAEELQTYDPQSDPNATGDPYKTLFVARLVRIVTDKNTNRPRGYAFIEYTHTRDMKTAYKQADGRKVDNKRVLVDVERGRTVPNWRPRRLGGGLGSSRIGGGDADKKDSTREQHHGGTAGRPRSEEPRRDDRRADRDREKSRERVRERDHRDERTHERSHDRTRDHDSREEKHHHRDRDRTRDRERGKDRERDHGRDRDRRDRDRDRDRGRDYDREKDRGRSHDRHRERGRERDRDYERTSHERDRGYLRERDADYANGGSEHDKSLSSYGQDYGYSQYEQHKGHEPYGYGQDGRGRETEHSKRHEHEYYRADSYGKMEANYQVQAHNVEPDGPEEGEAFEEGDYQYHQAPERMNEA